MKLNKKNKGKVHPSPPPSSSLIPNSHSTTTNNDSKEAISALKLLPAAILTLIAVLTQEDREVLAYLITRSIEATANPSLLLQDKNNRRCRSNSKRTTAEHKPPVFDCGCFDCYTSYWFRWDSSPNRELINQAIEAFEEHLATGERSSKKNARAGKRKDKIGGARPSTDSEIPESSASSPDELTDLTHPGVEELPEVNNEASSEIMESSSSSSSSSLSSSSSEEEEDEEEWPEEKTVAADGGNGNHRGLARKVLPDVIGLFHSRLWSLWSPNV